VRANFCWDNCVRNHVQPLSRVHLHDLCVCNCQLLISARLFHKFPNSRIGWPWGTEKHWLHFSWKSFCRDFELVWSMHFCGSDGSCLRQLGPASKLVWNLQQVHRQVWQWRVFKLWEFLRRNLQLYHCGPLLRLSVRNKFCWGENQYLRPSYLTSGPEKRNAQFSKRAAISDNQLKVESLLLKIQ
jgi:hypothetical protein